MSFISKGLYVFDEFELNPSARAFRRKSEPVSLSPKAFEVLTYLVANPGRVVTKDELLKAVWPDSFVEESNLAQHISWLRKALADKSKYITTVPGRGYQFTAEVRTESSPESLPEAQGGDIIVQRVRERTQVLVEESSPAPSSLSPPTKTRELPIGWLAGSLLAVALIATSVTFMVKRFSKPPALRKVVIADFLNLTGDPSFDHTLKSAFGIGLEQSPYIQIMGTGEEHSALQMMEKASDTPLLGDTALDVCRRKDYQALLRGKIELANFRYKLTMEVLGCVSGKTLDVFRAEAADNDMVLDTLDSLAERVRKKLGEPSESIERFQVPIREETTFSFAALKAFEIGSNLGNDGKLQECIPYFQKAVDLDPNFANAQASLGTAYYDLGAFEKAREYYKKAFNLSGNLSQVEKLYIRSNYYVMVERDLIAGRQNFEEWTQIYPGQESPWIDLDVVQTQLGNFPAAIEAGEHVLKDITARPAMAYEELARADMRQNRFADSKRTIAEGQASGKDDPGMHHILLQIAMIEEDPQALAQEIAWSQKNPELFTSLEDQAIFAAGQGRYHQCEELFDRAILDAAKEVNAELADNLRLIEAEVEVELGRTAQAKELLLQIKNQDSLDFAVVATKAGDISVGKASLQKPEEYPHGTFEHNVFLPELRALLALQRGDPASAIAALETSAPYDLAKPEVIDLRAQAYLAAHQGAKAQQDFQRLIDNPALEDPIHPRTILAHLGLARAYALENNASASREEYQKFFALWNHADSDLPVLNQARSEYARLR
jgi:eukaryotic-like serine/threonine-protein kinase